MEEEWTSGLDLKWAVLNEFGECCIYFEVSLIAVVRSQDAFNCECSVLQSDFVLYVYARSMVSIMYCLWF